MKSFAVAALLVCLTTTAAQAAPRYRVQLLTVTRGAGLFTTFGHTVLRVIDDQEQTDRIFDWGTYDPNDPMLLPKFFTGELRYKVVETTVAIALHMFERFFGGVVAQDLALTEEQVAGILARVQHDVQPANCKYLYHYFLDNCTTRVRDLLDGVLGGALAQATKGAPAEGDTYRSLIESAMPQAPVVRWAVYGMLNGLIDVPVDRWQRMFLPAYLMAELDRLRVAGPDGTERPFVSARTTLQGQPPVMPPPPPSLVPWLVLVAALALLSAWPAAWPRTRFARAWTGGFLALVGLVAGFHGALQVLAWLVAPYAESHANGNLVAAHPLLLTLVALGPLAAAGRRRAFWLLRAGLAAQVLVLVLALALRAAGLVVQHVEGFAVPGLVAAGGSLAAVLRMRR